MGHYVVMKKVDFCTDKDVQDHVKWNYWEWMRGKQKHICTYLHMHRKIEEELVVTLQSVYCTHLWAWGG